MTHFVRPAQPSDLAVLDSLYTERQTIVAQADPRLRPPVTNPQWLERTHGMVWVGGQPIGGYLSLWIQSWQGKEIPQHIGLIDHMTLDAHAYYPGLGRALIDAGWQWAQEHGVTQFMGLVPRYDPVSQAFWRSLHARPIHDVEWLKLSGYQVFHVIS